MAERNDVFIPGTEIRKGVGIEFLDHKTDTDKVIKGAKILAGSLPPKMRDKIIKAIEDQAKPQS